MSIDLKELKATVKLLNGESEALHKLSIYIRDLSELGCTGEFEFKNKTYKIYVHFVVSPK